MTSVNPSMRLKVKGDTYYVPDPDGRVYFQNNLGSFQMEGKGIDKWIEKLMPLFNGEHTLGELITGVKADCSNRGQSRFGTACLQSDICDFYAVQTAQLSILPMYVPR